MILSKLTVTEAENNKKIIGSKKGEIIHPCHLWKWTKKKNKLAAVRLIMMKLCEKTVYLSKIEIK